jgi:uncharacterized protein
MKTIKRGNNEPKIEIPKAWLEKFCQEHHIVKLALYGSVISNQFNDKSDVDILVEFDPSAVILKGLRIR